MGGPESTIEDDAMDPHNLFADAVRIGKGDRKRLGTYLPNEDWGTVYFIAPGVAERHSIRRAIAQRKLWELLAVSTFGLAVGMALAGIVEYLSM